MGIFFGCYATFSSHLHLLGKEPYLILMKEMKRLFLIFMILGLSLTSCSVDDDGSSIAYEFAPISNIEVPEFFEAGKSYDLKVSYTLPSTCHAFQGFQGGRDGSTNDFYIYASTAYESNRTDCSSEAALEKESTIRDFEIVTNAEDGDVYTFYAYTGQDSNDEPVFDTYTVSVKEVNTQTN